MNSDAVVISTSTSVTRPRRRVGTTDQAGRSSSCQMPWCAASSSDRPPRSGCDTRGAPGSTTSRGGHYHVPFWTQGGATHGSASEMPTPSPLPKVSTRSHVSRSNKPPPRPRINFVDAFRMIFSNTPSPATKRGGGHDLSPTDPWSGRSRVLVPVGGGEGRTTCIGPAPDLLPAECCVGDGACPRHPYRSRPSSKEPSSTSRKSQPASLLDSGPVAGRRTVAGRS